MYSAKRGDTERLKWLLARGANPNLQGLAGCSADFLASINGSALLWASMSGHIECVRSLLAAGADPNTPSRNITPLIAAASGGHLDVVRVLIEHTADLDTTNRDGKTALMMAAAIRPDQPEMVRALCEAGADVTLRDNHRCTAADLATEHDHLRSLEILYLFDANARFNGWGMLRLAVNYDAVAIVKSLLIRHPDITIQGMCAQQLFECAASRGNMELVQILLDARVDKKSLPIVLSTAAISGNPELVRMLCRMGYPKDSVQLAFNRALNCGHTDAALILQKYGAKLQKGYRF
jgi:ankyrin repeat protein